MGKAKKHRKDRKRTKNIKEHIPLAEFLIKWYPILKNCADWKVNKQTHEYFKKKDIVAIAEIIQKRFMYIRPTIGIHTLERLYNEQRVKTNCREE